MSVRKPKDRGWRIDVVVRRGGKSVRIKKAAKGARNKSEALAMERKLRAELDQRSNPLAKAPLFADFAADFLERYAKANNKPSEYDSKRDILHLHLVPWFGEIRMDEIEDEDCESYKAAKIKLGLSPKTVNNHGAVFSKLYAVAIDWKRVSRAPKMKPLKVPVPETDFLSFEEARRLDSDVGAVGRHARELDGAVHLDGEVIGGVGPHVLVERDRLVRDGHVVVAVVQERADLEEDVDLARRSRVHHGRSRLRCHAPNLSRGAHPPDRAVHRLAQEVGNSD